MTAQLATEKKKSLEVLQHLKETTEELSNFDNYYSPEGPTIKRLQQDYKVVFIALKIVRTTLEDKNTVLQKSVEKVGIEMYNASISRVTPHS